jgi:hypothetical protein
MGMIAAFYTLSDSNIDRILADPPLVWKVVAPDDPEIYESTRRGARPGLLARLLGQKKPPAPVAAALVLAEDESMDTDLDKAWHGIHYLLTQTDWGGAFPLNFLVEGGANVGDIEVGVGPARAFRAAEVQAIDQALRGIGEATLRARFDPAAMQALEIYPDAIWCNEEALDYCIEYFGVLKDFVARAAERRLGMLATNG